MLQVFLVHLFSFSSLYGLSTFSGDSQAVAGSWIVSLGFQVVYGLSKTIVTNVIQFSLNGIVLTVDRLASSTQICYLAVDVHADLVFLDVQMCLV